MGGGVPSNRECSTCYWEEVQDKEGNYPDHCNKCTDQDDYWKSIDLYPLPLTKDELNYMANSRLEHLEMENVDLHLQIEGLENKINILNTHIDRIYLKINITNEGKIYETLEHQRFKEGKTTMPFVDVNGNIQFEDELKKLTEEK